MQPLIITHPNGEQEVLYEPTEKQLLFHERPEPNVLFYGGRGSGKSVALRWEAHIRAMSYPGFRYVILRRTYPELQKSHLNFMTGEMKKLGGEFNKSEKIAYYPNGSKGFFSHCAGEEDVLNLLGSEFYWMGVDEISTFPWDMFTKLQISVRVPQGSGLIAMVRAATNPLGPSAEEINKYFIEKDVEPEDDPEYVPSDWYAIKANATDNPHLDNRQYIKRFVGLPDHVYKAWVEGDFVLENALFDVHPTKKVKITSVDDDGVESIVETTIPYHYVDTLDLSNLLKHAQVYRAVDNGWFPDPTYVLWIAHLGNRLVVFHEMTKWRTIAADIVDLIKEEEEKLGMRRRDMSGKLVDVVRAANTYCDPTMDINTSHDIHTLKDIYESRGIPMETSINSREMFASAIHSALGSEAGPNVPKLQIYTQGCPYLAKTLPKQRYDIKHPLKLADQKDDHPAVALAYFLISSGAMDRQALVQARTRPWMRTKTTNQWTLGKEGVK